MRIQVLAKLDQNGKFDRVTAWIADALILLFLLLITVGSYMKIKTAVVVVFFVLCLGLFALRFRRCVFDFIKSPILILWTVYCIGGLISTVFVERERDLYIFYSEATFTFILFVLTRYADCKGFFKLFRILMAVLVGCAFFEEWTGVRVFQFLKAGTLFDYEDVWTHGITSIFEYRHYFGCYLLLAFFSLFYFPEKNAWGNVLYGGWFLLAAVLTYTRSIWIAFAVGLIGLLIRFLKREAGRIRRGEKRPPVRKAVWIGAGIAFLIAISVSLFFKDRVLLVLSRVIHRFAQITPQYVSVANRMFTIRHGTAFILEHWREYLFFGMGSGAALKWLQTAPGATFTGAIDCQYVHTFMETGLIGLLSLFGMIGYAVVRFFKSRDPRAVLLTLTFGLIAVSFFFFEVIVVNSSVYALWTLVLVWIADTAAASEKRRPEQERKSKETGQKEHVS